MENAQTTGGGTPVLLGSYGKVDEGGLTVDGSGNIYICKDLNNSVIKIPAGGGAATNVGSGYDFPNGVVKDPAGNVFVSSYDNGSVVMVPAGGGASTQLISGEDPLNSVTLDKYGSLYVADDFNGVKKINRTGGYFISPALPAGLNFDETTGIISGTPTVSSAATIYTVTAYNSTGKTSKTITITVSPALNSHFAEMQRS